MTLSYDLLQESAFFDTNGLIFKAFGQIYESLLRISGFAYISFIFSL